MNGVVEEATDTGKMTALDSDAATCVFLNLLL